MASPVLEVRHVMKRFGAREVLRDISMDIVPGEFITILGESGSGKTTLLRLIAGFEKLDQGEIRMDGERLDHLPPYRRPVNTVFQQYALFPHLSVFENVAYGLRVRRVPDSDTRVRVNRALETVRMGSFATRAPATLSGGQQQRIALARAIVNQPKLLLLDEPLSALDAHLRRQMQGELKALQRELGITFVFVTHDQEEAMALSDRVALLRHGKLEQIASPREIYRTPATAYTAQFIGETNLQRATVTAGIVDWAGIRWPANLPDGPAVFSLRPERIRICKNNRLGKNNSPLAGAGDVIRFRGTIRNRTFEGATEVLELDCGNGFFLRARISSRSEPDAQGAPNAMETMEFEFNPADALRVEEST